MFPYTIYLPSISVSSSGSPNVMSGAKAPGVFCRRVLTGGCAQEGGQERTDGVVHGNVILHSVRQG